MAIKYYGQYVVTDTEAEMLALVPQAGQIGYPMDSKIRAIYNGTAWGVNASVTILRAQANVNANASGSTLFYTIPATSFRFVPLGAHIEVLTQTGTPLTAPTISVGTNATAYNNMFTTTALTSLLTVLSGTTSPNALTIASSITPLTAGTNIYARVTPGTGYTGYTIRIDVLGYWEV